MDGHDHYSVVHLAQPDSVKAQRISIDYSPVIGSVSMGRLI